MKKISVAAMTLLALISARGAWANPQNLNEYLEENLAKVEKMSGEERASILGAIRERFADYVMDIVTGAKRDGAKTVVSIITDSCKGKSPARTADVSFAAYRTVSRGADAALAEAVSHRVCEADINTELLLSWLDGYTQMRAGNVPAYVAEELVFIAMNNGWPSKTFDAVKWALIQGMKDAFAPRPFASYVFVSILKDPSSPGQALSDAKALFMNAKKSGVEPGVPAYPFRKSPPEPAKPQAQTLPQPRPAAETPAPLASEPKPKAETEQAPAPAPAPEPKPLFQEDFKSGYESMWEPIQVVGGNFEKFAKVGDGGLKVSVPENNSWGKTGLMSKTPFVTVPASTETAPVKIEFSFDENETTGFVIALSQAKNADVWGEYNVWLYWGRQSVTAGALSLVDTQNGGENYGTLPTPAKAPAKVVIFIQPGVFRFETSQGAAKEGKFSWLKPAASAYLYIFSHPTAQNNAEALTLKSIKVY